MISSFNDFQVCFSVEGSRAGKPEECPEGSQDEARRVANYLRISKTTTQRTGNSTCILQIRRTIDNDQKRIQDGSRASPH